MSYKAVKEKTDKVNLVVRGRAQGGNQKTLKSYNTFQTWSQWKNGCKKMLPLRNSLPCKGFFLIKMIQFRDWMMSLFLLQSTEPKATLKNHNVSINTKFPLGWFCPQNVPNVFGQWPLFNQWRMRGKAQKSPSWLD